MADATTQSDERFEEHFWPVYPKRDGRKRNKPIAHREWAKLNLEEQRRAVRGATNLAKSDDMPKDPDRFIRKRDGHFPFDDYQTAAVHDQPPSQLDPERHRAISRAAGLRAAGDLEAAESELASAGLALDVLGAA